MPDPRHSAAEAPPPPRWPRWLLRVTSAVSAFLLFNQAAIAAKFLSGSYSSLEAHYKNALLAAGSLALTLVAAILIRRVGRAPQSVVLAAAGLFALSILQIIAGLNQWLSIHIPVGIVIPLLASALCVMSWRRRW